MLSRVGIVQQEVNMYSFKDFVVANDSDVSDAQWLDHMSESANEVDEALSTQARLKLKAAMRKNKSKIAAGRRKSEGKRANKDQIEKRARKQAISAIKTKLLQGKSESELSFSARQALEKKVATKKGAINKLAKKLIKKVKDDEKAKFASKGGDE